MFGVDNDGGRGWVRVKNLRSPGDGEFKLCGDPAAPLNSFAGESRGYGESPSAVRSGIVVPILSILISTGCGSVSGLSGITPAGDTTPPSVTSTTPASEATVPADAPISVTFSEPMNTRSVAVSAQPSVAFGLGQWSTDERTVSFRLEAQLSPGTRYTIAVSGRDRAGNVLAPFSWSFTASAPGARAGAGEARLKDKVEARADERLFTLFAALNASGYDEGLKESGPVRETVRAKLGELTVKVVDPFRKFRAERPQPLEAYAAYVFSLTPPPEFAEQRAQTGLEGLNRILAEFYSQAKIADLWKAQADAHAKTAAAFAAAGVPAIGRVMDYLRATAPVPVPWTLSRFR